MYDARLAAFVAVTGYRGGDPGWTAGAGDDIGATA